MLGVDEAALRKEIWAPRAAPAGAAGKNVVSIGGREIALPDGVDAEKVTATDAEEASRGQELTAEERTLMRTVFASRCGGGNFRRRRRSSGGGFGGGGPPGGWRFAAAADLRGGFPGGGLASPAAGPQAGGRPAARTDYLFGGDYWVVAIARRSAGARGRRRRASRISSTARSSRASSLAIASAAVAEHESLRAAGALAGVHQPALRLVGSPFQQNNQQQQDDPASFR